jgi:shikimate kinase
MSPRVVLIGAMGAGKTTVGGLLADAWGVGFRDTDHDVETTTGRAISDIFVEDGEATFRSLERDAVATALAEHDGVLALGGGAVLDPTTQALLEGHHVVYLEVGLADASQRVGLGVSRPMLLGNVRGRVKQLLDERAPIYRRLASITVNTDGRSADAVASDVRAAIEGKDGTHE